MVGMSPVRAPTRAKQRRAVAEEDLSDGASINPNATPHTNKSPFLQLPSELRNRIYDYCAEEAPTGKLRIDLRNILSEDQKAKGIALTQVCKQIRAEYRPVYMSRAIIAVDWDDALHFEQDFFPGMDTAYDEPGQFHIHINLHETLELRQPTDITDMTTLYERFRNLTVRIHKYNLEGILDPIEMTLCSMDWVFKPGKGFSDSLWMNDWRGGKFASVIALCNMHVLHLNLLFKTGMAPQYLFQRDIDEAENT